MNSLENIHAIITGGASGLGLATAHAIVKASGKVTILDIQDEQGGKAVDLLKNNALFIKTDVTNTDQVNTAFKKTVAHMGTINLVVNCAGIAPAQRVLGKDGLHSTEDFQRVLNINVTGTFNVCRAAAELMQTNAPQADDERGVIVNTASIAAFDGQTGQAAYAASKGAIVSMTLPLAREFARIGVRVVSIAPGLFQTPMFDSLPEKAIDALTQNIPFPKRVGKPDEFAQLVLHIYQNTMVNGETLRLDGALRM